MRVFLCACLCACLLVGISTACFANEWRVGISHWPPFVLSQEEPYRGISVDVMREISKRLDIKMKMRDYPWTRMLMLLKTGEIDLVAFLAKNKEREEYVLYPSPYYKTSTVFYVKKGNRNLIEKYEDLPQFRIGVVKASEYFEPFNSDPRIQKHDVIRELLLLKLLDIGRVDAIVGTQPQISYDVLINGFEGKFEQAAYGPGNDVYLYTGVSKKSKFSDQVERISQAILAMEEEGQIKEIADRYLK